MIVKVIRAFTFVGQPEFVEGTTRDLDPDTARQFIERGLVEAWTATPQSTESEEQPVEEKPKSSKKSSIKTE